MKVSIAPIRRQNEEIRISRQLYFGSLLASFVLGCMLMSFRSPPIPPQQQAPLLLSSSSREIRRETASIAQSNVGVDKITTSSTNTAVDTSNAAADTSTAVSPGMDPTEYRNSPLLKKHTWLTDQWLHSCANELIAECEKEAPWCRKFKNDHPVYPLGDCIKMCARCGNGKNFQPDEPRPLALNYSKIACPRIYKKSGTPNPRYISGGNMDVVAEVMEQMKDFVPYKTATPPEDAIVLHLRVGDVIEESKDPVFTLLTQGGDPLHTEGYRSSIKSVYEYLDNIEQSGSKNVIIIGGTYKPQYFFYSRVYSGCLVRALEKAGNNVTINLDGGDADADFYYLSHSKHFIASAGGYSKLVGDMVKRLGGNVIGRTFSDMDSIKYYEENGKYMKAVKKERPKRGKNNKQEQQQ
ncbi:expressed unknown protein [Seminavis robusta]|uniref:Uncharacterized protein n=1 Tax=Seminavis robusta TaxID=568900 RepID=A0A9N8HRA5_9STRA|nr:expressed unknown protein [Seminavis robusta]|eukprot:Sro1295_g260310.1 n/a (409) ;mRNA; f:24517-25881